MKLLDSGDPMATACRRKSYVQDATCIAATLPEPLAHQDSTDSQHLGQISQMFGMVLKLSSCRLAASKRC